MNEGLTAATIPSATTNHLQLKVCKVTILSKEVCMSIDLI